MDGRRTLIVDAFTTEPLTGTPVGVVPDAAGLDADQMVAISRELGAPEAAFVTGSEVADRRLRYVTPEGETDLSRDATVAAHAYLFSEGVVGAGTHSVETNDGVFDVDVRQDGVVWIGMPTPEVSEVGTDETRVAAALGIDAGHVVSGELPIAVASAGMSVLVVPVDYLSTLGAMEPDHDAIEELIATVGVTGVYAFTFDTLDRESTLQGRLFVPGECITETPGRGAASGAVGAYLRFTEAFDEMPEKMMFERGHYVDRPGRVLVHVGDMIRIGGEAITSLDGELDVPNSDDDEIIEA